MLELAGIMELACDWIREQRPSWRPTWRIVYAPTVDVYDIPRGPDAYKDFSETIRPLYAIFDSMGLGSAVVIAHYIDEPNHGSS